MTNTTINEYPLLPVPILHGRSFLRGQSGPLPDGSDGGIRDLVGVLFDHFLDVSKETRIQYKRAIRPFLDWIEHNNGQLDPTTLIRWKRHLQSRNDLGSGSKNKFLTVARVLLRELHKWYPQHFPNLATGVKGFQVTRLHKRQPLSDGDLKQIWEYLDVNGDARTRVIVGLLYFQGLRRVELTRLRVEDCHPSTRTLFVHGKGRDDKESVDLHPKMVALLVDYLDGTNLKSGWLLPSPRTKRSLSSNMIWRIVTHVHQTLGITTNVHGYRKAFTSKLIDSGLNLLEVRAYTRHKQTSMLQVYYDRLDKQRTLQTYYDTFTP